MTRSTSRKHRIICRPTTGRRAQAPLGALFLAAVLIAPGACDKDEGHKIAPPGEVQVGIARVRIPAPVGIGTVGYGGFGVDSEDSPFNDIYPATTRVHGHPEFKAMVISRGPDHEVIFLRSDTVGIFQMFRRAVVLEVEDRLGRSVDDKLIFAGTHTHSGPGRLIKGGAVYDLIADTFFPDFYVRLVDAAATVVMDAYADLAPARVGYAWASCAEGHNDRRCDDGGPDYTNDKIPILAVERGGSLDAVLFAYAVHGTGLNIEDYTLSRDIGGGIEHGVEVGFDHPVMAMFFNSWGADMSPGSPDVPMQDGAEQPDGFVRLTQVGVKVGEAVHAALGGIVWQEDPTVFAEVHRVHINRDALGYTGLQFPYEWGGVYCSKPSDDDCDASTTIENLDGRCVPFPEEYPVPPQTELSAGRVGELAFVTFPGEPGTRLAEELLGRLETHFDSDNIMFIGYAQDYTGYSILEDDWWQGGYEASGAIWGPRQGEYLVDHAELSFQRTVIDGPRAGKDPDAPEPLDPFDVGEFTPYAPTPGEQVGTVTVDASAGYGDLDLVVVTVLGEDPWLGTPLATLEDDSGSPVTLANGVPVDSDGYCFWVDLLPDPMYSEERIAASRRFQWTFSMPVRQQVVGMCPDLSGGTYRLKILLSTDSGPQEVLGSLFTVE